MDYGFLFRAILLSPFFCRYLTEWSSPPAGNGSD
jgi:hypothetical protein